MNVIHSESNKVLVRRRNILSPINVLTYGAKYKLNFKKHLNVMLRFHSYNSYNLDYYGV